MSGAARQYTPEEVVARFEREWGWLRGRGFDGPEAEFGRHFPGDARFRMRHLSGRVAVLGSHDGRDDILSDFLMDYLEATPRADQAKGSFYRDRQGIVRLPVSTALLLRDPSLPDPARMTKGQARDFFRSCQAMTDDERAAETRALVEALLADFLGGSPAIFAEADRAEVPGLSF